MIEQTRKPNKERIAPNREKIYRLNGLWPWENEALPYRQRYRAYLKSPHWKERSFSARSSAGMRCEACFRNHKLTTHHLTYERMFRELPEDLMCLCWPCHKKAQDEFGATNPPRSQVQEFLRSVRTPILVTRHRKIQSSLFTKMVQKAELDGFFTELHSH